MNKTCMLQGSKIWGSNRKFCKEYFAELENKGVSFALTECDPEMQAYYAAGNKPR